MNHVGTLGEDGGSRGFYRLGRWIDRARTPEEQRFHDGGQGQQRQSRRQERMRQWKAGTFVPAWKRDMENAAARMHGQTTVDRADLRRLLNAGEPRPEGGTAAGGLDSIPEVVRDAPDDVSEDHTSLFAELYRGG